MILKHLLVGIVLCSAACLGASARAEFKAGAATSVITPPLGGEIVGGFVPFPAKHVHDELHARCIVLDDGETRLAFVVCDLLGLHRSVSDAARAEIESRLDIPASQVMISATHTHSAVSALGGRYQVGQELDDYQQFVVSRIVDGVQRAANLLRPAELAFAAAEVPEHVFNRRWHMREGVTLQSPYGDIDKVKMNPPGGSDDLLEPAGPTDPTVSILSLREPDGTPIAVLSAYSLHYVGGVGSAHISADYFGMFCEELKRLQEGDSRDPDTPAFVAAMANGTSGDINNVNFRKPRPRKKPYEQMRYVAHDVAAKVHSALEGASYRSDITLAAAYREPVMQWRRPSPATLAWAKAKLEEPESDRRDLPRIYAGRALALADHPREAPVPLQVFRIGDIGIGTMPCEVFVEIGLEFKERSPLQPAFLVSLAHGYFGYLPTPAHHELGGYETWLGTNRLETDASDKMLDHLIEMAESLKNGER